MTQEQEARLEKKIDALTSIVEKGFAAIAEDIANSATKEEVAGLATKVDLAMHDMATKEQMFALQTQVNSIEGQLRRNGRLEVRVGDLEEKVFGEVRG